MGHSEREGFVGLTAKEVTDLNGAVFPLNEYSPVLSFTVPGVDGGTLTVMAKNAIDPEGAIEFVPVYKGPPGSMATFTILMARRSTIRKPNTYVTILPSNDYQGVPVTVQRIDLGLMMCKVELAPEGSFPYNANVLNRPARYDFP